MFIAITPELFWASGGMADTPVLGTGLARGEGSSPFSPTRNGSRVILVQKRVYQFLSC